MPMTRGGVYYDLHESTYMHCAFDMCFVFSSVYNLDRFRKQLPVFVENETTRVEKTLGLPVTSDVAKLAAAKLYSKVQTRGFLVKMNGKSITSINDFKVNIKVVPISQ